MLALYLKKNKKFSYVNHEQKKELKTINAELKYVIPQYVLRIYLGLILINLTLIH